MKTRFLIVTCAALTLSFAACAEKEPVQPDTTENNSASIGGKGDDSRTESDLCGDTGGTWTDDASDAYYCLCAADKGFTAERGCIDRTEIQGACEATGGTYDVGDDYALCECPGDRWVDHGNCLAPDPAEEAACLDGGGTWTDDASDSWYCLCDATETYVVGDGCTARDDVRNVCEATGGMFEEGDDYAFCTCPGDRYVDHGNCLAPDPAHEETCLTSGGTWTDDASDSWYCLCADGSELFDGTACE